jgi:hypothetical protein
MDIPNNPKYETRLFINGEVCNITVTERTRTQYQD